MEHGKLGDALDLAKRALLAALPEDVHKHLAVVVMPSDGLRAWSAEARAAYRHVLGVPDAMEVLWEPGSAIGVTRRTRLAVQGSADLFIDVSTGLGSDDSKHLSLREIHDLLTAAPSRVLLIFQDYSRGTFLQYARSQFSAPLETGELIRWFAYAGGAMNLLVVSCSEQSLASYRQSLSALFGSVANSRLIQ